MNRSDVELLAPMEPLSARSCRSESPWRRLWAWMDFERQDIWVSVAYAAAVGVFTLATPLAVQSLFNTVAFGTLIQPLLVLTIVLAVALGFSAVLNALQLLIIEHIGRRVFLRTAMDFASRLPLVRSRLGNRDLDELSNRFLDVVVVEKSMSEILFSGLSAVLQISVGLILLAVYHPFLLAFDLGLIVCVLFVVFILGRRAVDTAIYESKKKYEIFAWLQDIAKNSLSFRSNRGTDYAHRRTGKLAETWLSARREHFTVQFRQVIGMLTIQVVATTLLLALGGFLVLEGQLSLGQLVAAELVIGLTVSSLAKIGQLFGKLYDLIAALDKIGTVLDLDAPVVDGEKLEDARHGLTIDARIDGFDLQLAPSEKRLVCATESPQALAVIDGVTSPASQPRGALRLDNIDARDIAIDSMHERVLLLRSTGLFPGSVRDNLTLGDDHIDRPQLQRALEAAGVEEAVESLQDGLDTKLNRAGFPLNSEDQSRVLLARALVLKPRLLIVDRVFDSLGVQERHAIIDELFSNRRPWTVLYLTAHGHDHQGDTKRGRLEEVVA